MPQNYVPPLFLLCEENKFSLSISQAFSYYLPNRLLADPAFSKSMSVASETSLVACVPCFTRPLCKRVWAGAPMAKYHRLGGLRSINLFSYSLESSTSKIKVLAGVLKFKFKVFFWGISPWLADSHFLTVSSHGLFLCVVRVLISSYDKDTSYQ